MKRKRGEIIIKTKIGIPRALLYYYYYPAWQEYFNNLGLKVVLSPETNKNILNNGVNRAVDDLCLPFKSYFGHVSELIYKIDYLLVPRLVSLGKNNTVCPKFMGLPDMVKAVFPATDLPDIIAPEVDLNQGVVPFRRIAHQIGSDLNKNYLQVEKAYWKAVKKQKEFNGLLSSGLTPEEVIEAMNQYDSNKKMGRLNQHYHNRLNVAVLGHSYLLNDSFISMGILDILRELNIGIKTYEMVEREILEREARKQPKTLFWYYNRHVLGAAYYFLKQDDIDGIIQVNAFGCGPDSMTQELVKIKGKEFNNKSILNVNLDEHSGKAGLKTRLEAFIDLLERRKAI